MSPARCRTTIIRWLRAQRHVAKVFKKVRGIIPLKIRSRSAHSFLLMASDSGQSLVLAAAAAKSAPPPGRARQRLAVAGCGQSAASRRGSRVTAASTTSGWYTATVPGTVLTTLVNNHVYPEPLYGENNRPEIIPDSLARTSYWYRTADRGSRAYKDHHVWLNFDGINYSAAVWVNGAQVGTMRGAFIRGIFDITAHVTPGKTAVVAVLVTPQPQPRRSARTHPARGHGHERRHQRHRRSDVSLHHRLGLDSRHSRPRHRHLAKGLSLRHRPGAC